jgi:hypothetical protein
MAVWRYGGMKVGRYGEFSSSSFRIAALNKVGTLGYFNIFILLSHRPCTPLGAAVIGATSSSSKGIAMAQAQFKTVVI